jgi:hypothetical protein
MVVMVMVGVAVVGYKIGQTHAPTETRTQFHFPPPASQPASHHVFTKLIPRPATLEPSSFLVVYSNQESHS